MPIDFESVAAQIERATSRAITLSPAGVVLALAALEYVLYRGSWREENSPVDDETWDIIENWISTTALDLMIPTECDEMLPYVLLWHKEEKTTDGGSTIVGLNKRPITEVYDPFELILNEDNSSFKFVPGEYLIEGSQITIASGWSTTFVADETGIVAQGICVDTASPCVINDFLTVESDVWYSIGVNCTTANGGNGLGTARNFGNEEVYAEFRLTKLP